MMSGIFISKQDNNPHFLGMHFYRNGLLAAILLKFPWHGILTQTK